MKAIPLVQAIYFTWLFRSLIFQICFHFKTNNYFYKSNFLVNPSYLTILHNIYLPIFCYNYDQGREIFNYLKHAHAARLHSCYGTC